MQLSKRRPGRIYDERNIANFREGFKHLEGHLSKWAVRTSNARIRYMQHGAGDAVAEESDDESDWDDDSDDEQDNTMTAGDIAQNDTKMTQKGRKKGRKREPQTRVFTVPFFQPLVSSFFLVFIPFCT